MFVQAYIDTAIGLLENYQGAEPFHLYLKRYYGVFKKFGSRDRKHITQLCYSWFRAGHALKHLERKQQLLYALFLCSNEENKLLGQLSASLGKKVAIRLDEKLQIVQEDVGFQLQQLFPWNAELSSEIDTNRFNQSLLIQPNLYLRLRPGKEEAVVNTLRNNNILFEKTSGACLAVSNNTKADQVLKLDEDAVVQDMNSQRALDILKEHGVLKKFSAWDCCAASGGKSLLLMDTFSNVRLIVSDLRQTILHNLHSRFQKAGIKKYRWFVADAAKEAPPHHEKFDLIICDAPCSGSGTWSRTPEQLHHFTPEKLDAYAQLQKSIVSNVSRYINPGGLLVYITCSVFKKENEDMVEYISKNCGVNFLKSAYYKGYDQKADTLFAALFKAL